MHLILYSFRLVLIVINSKPTLSRLVKLPDADLDIFKEWTRASCVCGNYSSLGNVTCQCDLYCTRADDCCPDYHDKCLGTDPM